jgi:hypothetical protein
MELNDKFQSCDGFTGGQGATDRETGCPRNVMQGEIKRRMNSGNACYHSVQNLLSSRLLSKNLKIRIYIEYKIRIYIYILEYRI